MRLLSLWPLSHLDRRIRESPLGARLARGTFWSTAAAAISMVLKMVSLIVVARVAGMVHFGELGIIQATVGSFQVFAGFGMGITATKHVAEFRSKDPAKAGRIITLCLVVTAAGGVLVTAGMWVLAPVIATSALGEPHLAGLLQVSSGMLLFGVMVGVQTGILAGFEAFKSIALVNLISWTVSLPIVVAGVKLWGLEGAVWGLVASWCLNALLGQDAVRRVARRSGVPLDLRGAMGEREVFWGFAVPAYLAGLIVFPITWIGMALLVRQPGGLSEMAIFHAANQWRGALLFLPATVATAFLPVLSDLYGRGRWREYRKVLGTTALIAGGITLIAGLIISLAAPWIMGLYKFTEGNVVLIFLALTAFLFALAQVAGLAIVSSGRMWAALWLNAFWGIAFVLSATLLVHRGASGLALAFLIAYGLHLVAVGLFTYASILKSRPSPEDGEGL